MQVAFYDRAGRTIDRLEVPLNWVRKGNGFQRVFGDNDIAGITIENLDPAGIAIDNIIFDVTRPSS